MNRQAEGPRGRYEEGALLKRGPCLRKGEEGGGASDGWGEDGGNEMDV